MSVRPWTRDFTTAPLDFVLHRSVSSSVFVALIKTRIAEGDRPKDPVQVACRGDRWFARVEWESEKYSALLFPTDVHTLEPRL